MKKAAVKSNFEKAKMLNEKYIALHQIYRFAEDIEELGSRQHWALFV